MSGEDDSNADDETLSHVAAASAIKESIAFLGTAAAYLVFYYVTHPGEWQLTKMKFYLRAKRICQSQADMWQHAASSFATNYQREKA
jgi:hypothetical protein